MKPRSLPKPNVADDVPLSRAVRARHSSPEAVRARRSRSWFAPFSLKYAVMSETNGRRAFVNGKPVTHFGSHNYLGLDRHPEVLYAAKRAIDELGTETGAARGDSSLTNFATLEGALAAMLGAEACVVGANLFQVHAEAIEALFRDGTLFLDRGANAELQAAARSAHARVVHVDAGDHQALARAIRRESFSRGALLIDGVRAGHGHRSDIAALAAVCNDTGLALYLDDADGVGVLGKNGGGGREAAGVDFRNLVLVGSLQKAFGSYGAFVAARADVIDLVRTTGRFYATAATLPPSAVEAALAAVRIARGDEGTRLREALAMRSRSVRAELREMGFVVPPGEGPIVPVIMGRDLKTLLAARRLFDLGVFVTAVLTPDAPRGRGLLRVSLTALHRDEDVAELLRAFRELRHYLPRHENPLRQAAHLALEVVRAKWRGTTRFAMAR